MTTGKLHPADERALAILFESAREVAARLAPGRRADVVIERGRGPGRLTGRVVETHYPLDDSTTTLDTV